ncbi:MULTISPECIES: peroxiredoxin [Salimicrobium]|uniref:Peroxiredoxin n=4 Tax=Salimicrobium TaxID=351195 RepID=K2FKP6_9BACI|nr:MULTISPECIES: peroxiredoxin [Salimicrobium]AKG04906.1 peroxiredoxin [Salimicrobium jeotgali]EKE31576.1 Peroxiredoxin [Salimicrobium jeotgali]MBM7696396.1 peroxiredoxin (alkyl hydroperoxide reductase subunit C) [Salimicrobium jeotgali]PBB06191.1 peroxiredoxin [Salimicrobium humidisoli]SDX42895.1 peroxiredoxin (alkyl hydroperoxide reductase subunit C) [Salimicrobium album]
MMEEQHNTEEQKHYGLPRIGEKAPDFTAQTTHGELSLDDYEGKWFVLFSHPADFTPVCTTEFVAFQGIYDQLREMNTELLGLSVDSITSHIAWIRNIEENFDTKIEFPVIADLDKQVATKFGMIMPESSGTEASRAVFVIDDKGTIRSLIYYPLTTGRNMGEIVRLVEALRTTDKHGVSTPADWTKGNKVVASPPKTVEDARARENDDSYECVDWYFCKKDLKE